MLKNKSQRTLSVIAGALLILTSSCSSSKNSPVTTADRNDVKGTWVLDNITYDGIPQGQKVKLTLLGEGDETCLKGSTWVFPNNSNGTYTIAQNESTGCIPGERNIVWSYREENGKTIFQYKRLPGGVKAKDIADGYKFDIVSATDSNLALRANVAFEGSTIGINYFFIKK